MDVLYIGDYKLQANQFYVGADTFQQFYRKVRDYEALLDALKQMPGVGPEYLDGPDTMTDFPRSVEKLQEYDALIISDLSRGTLEPHFFDDSIPGPNMLRIIKQYVENGGGLVYAGGWMTYQGYQGVGNWQGTLVEDVLPVDIKAVYDDRAERPEGIEPSITATEHPLVSDLGTDGLPTVYGYNEVAGVSGESELVATIEGNPLLAAGEFGTGRTVAYTSDPCIMWGLGMVEWDDYRSFWHTVLKWATRSR
jgi:uncharacterized membrane protein